MFLTVFVCGSHGRSDVLSFSLIASRACLRNMEARTCVQRGCCTADRGPRWKKNIFAYAGPNGTDKNFKKPGARSVARLAAHVILSESRLAPTLTAPSASFAHPCKLSFRFAQRDTSAKLECGMQQRFNAWGDWCSFMRTPRTSFFLAVSPRKPMRPSRSHQHEAKHLFEVSPETSADMGNARCSAETLPSQTDGRGCVDCGTSRIQGYAEEWGSTQQAERAVNGHRRWHVARQARAFRT